MSPADVYLGLQMWERGLNFLTEEEREHFIAVYGDGTTKTNIYKESVDKHCESNRLCFPLTWND